MTRTNGLVLAMLFLLVSGNAWAKRSVNLSELKIMTKGCTFSFLSKVESDFRQVAIRQGRPGVEFPGELLRPSVQQLCECLTRRGLEQYSFNELNHNRRYVAQTIAESLSKGHCKPSGVLGKLMLPQQN